MLPDLAGVAQQCASGNPAAGICTALMRLGMTLIRANTLAFASLVKMDHIEFKTNFWEYEFGIWKQGRTIGILGIYVWNSRNSAQWTFL
jgi:hypothetical protein